MHNTGSIEGAVGQVNHGYKKGPVRWHLPLSLNNQMKNKTEDTFARKDAHK